MQYVDARNVPFAVVHIGASYPRVWLAARFTI